MKCKHENSWTITEYYTNHQAEHTYEGGLVMHNLREGNLTAMIKFDCHTCNRKRYYSRFSLPKWLATKFEDISYKPDFTD